MITRFLRTLQCAMQGQPQGGFLADVAWLGNQEPGFGLPTPLRHGAPLLGAKTRLHSATPFGTRFSLGLGAIAGMVYAIAGMVYASLIGGVGLPNSDPSLNVYGDTVGVPSPSAISRFSPIHPWLSLVDVRQPKSGRFRLRLTSP